MNEGKQSPVDLKNYGSPVGIRNALNSEIKKTYGKFSFDKNAREESPES
jgi:hypothetical protein